MAWAWRGEINGWLLGLLLLNIVVCGGALWWAAGKYGSKPPRLPGGGSDEPNSARLPGGESNEKNSFLWGARGALGSLPIFSSLIALIALLTHVHGLPPEPLPQTVASLNRAVQPTDAIITNDPALTTGFAELYAGRAPVLGLNHGRSLPADIEQRLRQIMADHKQVWWLPNWLPPGESGVEQLLLVEGFQARAETFGQQRLLLFAFPPALVEQPLPATTTFADAIQLEAVALPPQVDRGQALPVALTWQSLTPLTKDYHVFVHLVDAQGQVVAQADGQPAHWTRPTSTWAVGERIVDRHGLWLPTDISAGLYQMVIGLYQPADGQRLRLTGGADGVWLAFGVR